jgi:hypothetical protein
MSGSYSLLSVAVLQRQSIEDLIARRSPLQAVDPQLARRLLAVKNQGRGRLLLWYRKKAQERHDMLLTRKMQELLSGLSSGDWAAEAAASWPGPSFMGVSLDALQKSKGVKHNRQRWTVVYVEKSGGKLKSYLTWDALMRRTGRTADLSVFIKPRGDVGAALDDIWRNPLRYGFECFTGSALMVLRGIMLELQAKEPKSWRRTLNAQQSGFYIAHTVSGPTSSLMSRDLKQITLAAPVMSAGVPRDLRRGDWVYFQNPYLKGEWVGESAIYLGGGKFRGHGIHKEFDFAGYADFIRGLDRNYWRQARPRSVPRSWVLGNSKIAPRYRRL